MKLLIFILLVLAAYFLYKTIMQPTPEEKGSSSLRKNVDETVVQSQLLKQELEEDILDAKDKVGAAVDNAVHNVEQLKNK